MDNETHTSTLSTEVEETCFRAVLDFVPGNKERD